jgi:Beta-glucan synthesis-associated protein SKN1/KRE6/Sbg1
MILGNLGRATYEASTNNIWPWSFNTCDRKLQQAQAISACNEQNHFGMHPRQGRGATEIDIVEVMTGTSNGALAGTHPPIKYPYADFTLQVCFVVSFANGESLRSILTGIPDCCSPSHETYRPVGGTWSCQQSSSDGICSVEERRYLFERSYIVSSSNLV